MSGDELVIRPDSGLAAPTQVPSRPLVRLDYEQTLAARRVAVVGSGLAAMGVLAGAVAQLSAFFGGSAWSIWQHSPTVQALLAFAGPLAILGPTLGGVALASVGVALIGDRVRAGLRAIDPDGGGVSAGAERAALGIGVAAAGWFGGAAAAVIAGGAALWVTRPGGVSTGEPDSRPALIRVGVPVAALAGVFGPGALTVALNTGWHSWLPGVAGVGAGVKAQQAGVWRVIQGQIDAGGGISDATRALYENLGELVWVSELAEGVLATIAIFAVTAPVSGLIARALRRRFPSTGRAAVAALAALPAGLVFLAWFVPGALGPQWYTPVDSAAAGAWVAVQQVLSAAAAAAFLLPHLAFAALDAGSPSGATAALPGGAAGPDALAGGDPVAAALPEIADETGDRG